MNEVPKRDLGTELPYAGLRVGRLWLDQGFALELHPSQPPADDAAVVRLLWKEFTYRDPAGREHRLLPHEHSALTPVFELIGTHVAEARVSSDGDLELLFENGARIDASDIDDGWEHRALQRS